MNYSSVLSPEVNHQSRPAGPDEDAVSYSDFLRKASHPEVSLIMPCYNEQENLAPLVQQLKHALESCTTSYELIFIDDGSNDMTENCLRNLTQEDKRVRGISHTKNFGQSAALLTGIQHARGEVVISMDADLQNDPADIPAMLELLKNADAVCGIRQIRQDSRVKKISSRVANWFRQWLLQDEILDAGCCFRAIRRDALQQLPAFRALHRFLPTILKIHGYRVTQMSVRHHPRIHGYSKYGVGNRLFVGIYDLVGIAWYKSRHIPTDRHKAVDQTNLTY